MVPSEREDIEKLTNNLFGKEMNPNWQIYYRNNNGESPEFAEVRVSDTGTTLRRGAIFTHGEKSDGVEDVAGKLEGFALAREWIFDPKNPDYAQLEREITDACLRECGEHNAFALITDSSLMTIGIALHKFEDIDSADDEQLWIVDEWDRWLDDGGLDPAFRWLLAYGFHNDEETPSFEAFQESVVAVFQRCLKKLPDSVRIRLVYVGGDDCGHQWSADCMEAKDRDRLLNWI